MDEVYALWFRRDFRLQDHHALYKLAERLTESGGSWFGFFIVDPMFTEEIDLSNDYFFQTVEHFCMTCEKNSIPIQIMEGKPEEQIKKLLENVENIKGIYTNEDEWGYGKERDDRVKDLCEAYDVEFHSFLDYNLHGSYDICKKDGGLYQVFTPYYKVWRSIDKPQPYPVPIETLKEHHHLPDEIESTDFCQLLKRCELTWERMGEEQAYENAKQFVNERLGSYNDKRDIPSKNGTSRLSFYLRTGTLSIRTLYSLVEEESDSDAKETYVKELAWRDFYNCVLTQYPNAENEEIQDKYRGLEWHFNENLFEAWREGKTGFPIVDAGMRQMNSIGWMHNRLRMITASFLSKDLLVNWRYGEQYFARKLIDYDPASNIGGWQWAASVGTDAVPYFRIFNPTTQSKRFDPDGAYIRKWIPELNDVPKKYIHEPWKMNKSDQQEYGCMLGKDYPEPIVDHRTQREKALSLYEELK